MKAVYFDTEDFILSQHETAFRIRSEGDRVVGTLKWRGGEHGALGLYAREEVNVPVSGDACFLSPDPTIFEESEYGEALLGLIDGKPLVGVFETIFGRKSFRIDTRSAICEVSIDEGKIIAGEKTAPIHELEIELFSGTEESLLKIGEDLVKRYGIEPEPLSKYARGLALARGKDE
jgi:inorganic triphosphatase YgiF